MAIVLNNRRSPDAHLRPPRRADHRWLALGLVCLVQFMVVLDTAIVTLAPPAIKTSLREASNALTSGFDVAFTVVAGFALAGAVIAIGLLHPAARSAEPALEAA